MRLHQLVVRLNALPRAGARRGIPRCGTVLYPVSGEWLRTLSEHEATSLAQCAEDESEDGFEVADVPVGFFEAFDDEGIAIERSPLIERLILSRYLRDDTNRALMLRTMIGHISGDGISDSVFDEPGLYAIGVDLGDGFASLESVFGSCADPDPANTFILANERHVVAKLHELRARIHRDRLRGPDPAVAQWIRSRMGTVSDSDLNSIWRELIVSILRSEVGERFDVTTIELPTVRTKHVEWPVYEQGRPRHHPSDVALARLRAIDAAAREIVGTAPEGITVTVQCGVVRWTDGDAPHTAILAEFVGEPDPVTDVCVVTGVVISAEE